MGLSSLIISIIVIEWGIKWAFLFYIGSISLGFFLLQNKIHWIVYAMTFGEYGLVKSIIETKVDFRLQKFVKIIFANIVIMSLYCIVKNLIAIRLNIILLIGCEVLFVVYDYAYSVFVDYYNKNLRNKIIKYK
jgi:hypothetical protein